MKTATDPLYIGVHALVALDDSRTVGGITGLRIRYEILRRYMQTCANGGTSLTFAEWHSVIRDANNESPENLEAASALLERALAENV